VVSWRTLTALSMVARHEDIPIIEIFIPTCRTSLLSLLSRCPWNRVGHTIRSALWKLFLLHQSWKTTASWLTRTTRNHSRWYPSSSRRISWQSRQQIAPSQDSIEVQSNLLTIKAAKIMCLALLRRKAPRIGTSTRVVRRKGIEIDRVVGLWMSRT